MIEHWMTTGLIGTNGSFQRAAREYAEEYAALAVAAERERCAKICDAEAAGFGGVVAGPMATERGKLVHEAMAAGAISCAASIRASAQKENP